MCFAVNRWDAQPVAMMELKIWDQEGRRDLSSRVVQKTALQVPGCHSLRFSLKTLLESFSRKAAAFCLLVLSSIALTESTLTIRQKEPPILERRGAVQQVRLALQDQQFGN